jgi:hypothetical protein
MPLSSTQRAWIAVGIVLCLAGAALGFYFYRARRPLPGSSAGTAPELLTQLPSDAPAIAYFDVAELRRSPVVLKIAAMAESQEDPEYKRFARDTGFDYTRDLDRLGLAFWPGHTAQIPLDRAVILADGRFDRQKIDAYIAADPSIHRGPAQAVELPPLPGFSKREFAFVSPGRVAYTAGAEIAASVQRNGAARINPALEPLIQRVAGAPVFAVMRAYNLPDNFYASFKGSPQLEHFARSIRGIAVAGKPDGNRLHLVLDAECDSMKNAIAIAAQLEILRMFGSAALADPRTRRQMDKQQAALAQALLNQVQVTHQDVWVRLTLDVTPEMFAPPPATPSADPPRRPPAAKGDRK